jgi:hypothetical protein
MVEKLINRDHLDDRYVELDGRWRDQPKGEALNMENDIIRLRRQLRSRRQRTVDRMRPLTLCARTRADSDLDCRCVEAFPEGDKYVISFVTNKGTVSLLLSVPKIRELAANLAGLAE